MYEETSRHIDGLKVGSGNPLCAVDFSNLVDIVEGGSSRASLSYMIPPRVTTTQRGCFKGYKW